MSISSFEFRRSPARGAWSSRAAAPAVRLRHGRGAGRRHATARQRTCFDAGQGGTLTPLMCVDKAPEDLDSFETLLEESRQLDQACDIVFVAALAGTDDARPTALEAEAPLQRLVESIKSGSIGGFIPLIAGSKFDARASLFRVSPLGAQILSTTHDVQLFQGRVSSIRHCAARKLAIAAVPA